LVAADRGHIGRRHGAAVQRDQVEAAAEAADRDLRAFAVGAVDRHAGDALQRFGEVGVGELADVFGRDGVDDAAVAALDLDRAFQRGPDARDDDFVDRLVLVIALGLGLAAGENRHGQRQQRRRSIQTTVSLHSRFPAQWPRKGLVLFCFSVDKPARFFATFAKNNRASTATLAVTSLRQIGQAAEK
jgi:hypothetical protein